MGGLGRSGGAVVESSNHPVMPDYDYALENESMSLLYCGVWRDRAGGCQVVPTGAPSPACTDLLVRCATTVHAEASRSEPHDRLCCAVLTAGSMTIFGFRFRFRIFGKNNMYIPCAFLVLCDLNSLVEKSPEMRLERRRGGEGGGGVIKEVCFVLVRCGKRITTLSPRSPPRSTGETS
jgi:hypothetical protein